MLFRSVNFTLLKEKLYINMMNDGLIDGPGTFHALRLLSAIYFLAQYTIVSVKNYVGLRFLHRRRGYLGSFKEL